MGIHLKTTGCRLPWITQCYLPPDTSERSWLDRQIGEM